MKYIPESLQDAMDDGIEIGELRKAREMVPNELRETLESIEDMVPLEQLFGRAAFAESIEVFMQFVDVQVRRSA